MPAIVFVVSFILSSPRHNRPTAWTQWLTSIKPCEQRRSRRPNIQSLSVLSTISVTFVRLSHSQRTSCEEYFAKIPTTFVVKGEKPVRWRWYRFLGTRHRKTRQAFP